MRRLRSPLTRTTTAILLAAGLTAPALAQSNAQGLMDNSFVINASAFVVGTEIRARLNGQSTNNPEIDFDDTFGKSSDATRPRLDMLWRINPRHQLRFLYFDNSNSRTRTLERDVGWGDYVFRANATVTAEIDFKVYELAYEYAFVRTPSYELALGLGVHATDFALRLSGVADLTGPSGGVVSTGVSSQTADVLAPLPVIGVRGGWVVAPNWYLDGQAQVFALNSNGIEGNWSDLRLGVTWMFHRSFGIGLSYNRFATDVDIDRTTYRGGLKLSYGGALVSLTGTF
jgi:hypothetical protein